MAVIPRLRRKPRPDTMTVVEHLDELRRRLFIAITAVAVAGIGGWFLYGPVVRILTGPYCDFMSAHPQLAVNPEEPCKLIFLTVVEPFITKLKVAAFLGLGMALPIVLYQLWMFIVPGLTDRERRFALPFVLTSLVLFVLGGWFAMLTLPRGLNFLLGFAGGDHIALQITFARYLGFVMLLILAFGVAFEFPLLLVSLTLVGVLTSRQLRAWRRYALLGTAIAAAVLTPSQDWFTMLALMVPLVVFYELAILVSRLLKR